MYDKFTELKINNKIIFNKIKLIFNLLIYLIKSFHNDICNKFNKLILNTSLIKQLCKWFFF